MAQPHAVIVGGGIGGLTTAAALHDRGWAVTLCERDPSPGAAPDVGVGLLPNGLRALDSLGLGDALRAAAARPPLVVLRRPDGRVLLRLDQGKFGEKYGDPAVVAARSALVRLLLGRLPARAVHPGVAVTAVEPGDAHRLARVRTTAGELSADLVVAADGARSTIRAQLFPDVPEPAYAGFTSWRFLAPLPSRPVVAGETWGRGAVFGVLPLPDGRVYCYATAGVPAGQRRADERAELLRLFGDWHEPVPELLRSVAPQAVVRSDALVADDPLPAYHVGRVALVGDAAHALPPNLDQGVCLAVEDAAVLAHRASASAAYLPVALASYTDDRLGRTRYVVQRVAQFAELAQASSPVLARGRDAGIRMVAALAPHRAVHRFLESILQWRPPRQGALL